jgi:hypothetical protein
MVEFIQKDQPQFLGVEDWEPPINPTGELTKKRKAEDAEYANTVKASDLQQDVYFERIEASPLNSPTGVDFPSMFDESVEDREAFEALQELALKSAEFDRILAKGETISAEDILNAKDPAVTANYLRYSHRLYNAANRLLDLAESYEGGNVDKVYEVLDQFAYDTYASYRDVGQGITGGGTELTTLTQEHLNAMTTMNDEEYDRWIDERIASLASMTTREPSWQVYRELQAIEAAGIVMNDDLLGYMSGGLAAADIATLGTVGAIKIGSVGRSLIGRLRSAKGTQAATAAAKAAVDDASTAVAIRTGLDGEVLPPQLAIDGPVPSGAKPNKPFKMKISPTITDADVVEDILPTGMASTVRSKGAPVPPPVSQGVLNTTVTRNQVVKAFLQKERSGAFGMTNIADNAAEWAKNYGREVASVRGTHVIDFDLSDEGLQNFAATWRLGKKEGKPFTSYKLAARVADTVPNARVIDLSTGKLAPPTSKSKQFAVEFSERYAEKPSMLDLGEVKVKGWFAKWFGNASRGTSIYFSNLAYAADSSATKFRLDVKSLYSTLNKLTKNEKDATSAILSATRDDGKQLNWKTSEEFLSDFKKLTGELPRPEVVRQYEDLVAASDFSWFVMASDRLRFMARKKTLMFKYKDAEHAVYPIDTKPSSRVYNASTGTMIEPKDLPQGVQVYKFMYPGDGWPEYVAYAQGRTRLPELTDAYAYNAGGPRMNPELQWFIGTEGKSWATALGAKTQREANIAVNEINTIQAKIRALGLDDTAMPLNKKTLDELDDLIQNNNSWNPSIETFPDFVEFTKGRGIKLGKAVVKKPRNASIHTFVEFADDFLISKDLSALIAYSRHDLALVEFGGHTAYNPNPIQSIINQMNTMIDRGAQTQYRLRHVTAWAEAVMKAADPQNYKEVIQIKGLGPMTPENMAKNIEIVGESTLAKKLRQEQSVIVRRLNMLEGSTSEGSLKGARQLWTNTLDAMIENTYNNGKYMVAPEKIARGLRGIRDNTSGGLLSTGFMLKMASPFQVLLQGAMAIQITAVSPVNGLKATFLAGFIRQMAKHPQGTAIQNGLYKNLARAMGMTDDELQALSDHFANSGRGYMRGAVVEDPHATPGEQGIISKAAGIARSPYYMGENFAATVSRITAYLDVLKKHPKIDKKSQAFWNTVATRDRSLSLDLNRPSASYAQHDSIMRVVTQWTSYFTRAIEKVFFDDALTKGERVRLLASFTILWGTAGFGVDEFLPQGEESMIRELVRYGMIDYVLKEALGVTLGNRLAINIPDLIGRAMGTIGDPEANVPAAAIALDGGKYFFSGVNHLFYGRGELGSYDLARLVRTFKAADDLWMAYTMMMNDVRTSRTGTEIEANFTTFQAFAQAVGLSPYQVTELNNMSSVSYRQHTRMTKAAENAAPLIKMGMEKFEEGDTESAAEYFEDAAAMLDAYGLSAMYRADASNMALSLAGRDKFEAIMTRAVESGQAYRAMKYLEGNK